MPVSTPRTQIKEVFCFFYSKKKLFLARTETTETVIRRAG